MKVISWNIWSKGAGKRLDSIASFLRAEEPDLVALQEVDRFWGERSANLDVSKELAEMIGYNYFFSPSINVDGGEYGNAILAKPEIIYSESVALSPEIDWQQDNHETEPRSAAIAVFKKPKPTVLISTHLANAIHLKATDIHQIQVKRIISVVRDLKKRYPRHLIVLAGDFNLTPDKPEIKMIDSEIKRQGEALLTWPSQPFAYKGWVESPPPSFSIDHIFASEKFKTKTQNSSISDHLPVVGETIDA